MLSLKTGSLQYQLSSHNVQKKMQKILDTYVTGATITQQLSNSATQQLSNSATQGVRIVHALINGQLFHSDNNIIIVSHQFLQTASVVLGFFILNRKGR